jgi:hypothetical protein
MNDDMNINNPHDDLSRELAQMVDRVTGDIAAETDGWYEPDDLELAAAEVAVAYAERSTESLPPALQAKLKRAASQGNWNKSTSRAVAGQITPQSAPTEPKRPLERGEINMPPLPGRGAAGKGGSRAVFSAAGWLAAAAAIAIAAIGWMRPAQTTPSQDPDSIAQLTAEERLVALDSDPRSVSDEWFAWYGGTLAPENDPRPAAEQVTGRYVWNEAIQEGYMVFENMPINDPSVEQYQLWLVSADHEHPIDGGVFDIATGGRVIVPIDPKISATNIAALGITVEKPGGVVVSSREDRMVASLVPQG